MVFGRLVVCGGTVVCNSWHSGPRMTGMGAPSRVCGVLFAMCIDSLQSRTFILYDTFGREIRRETRKRR